MIDAYIWFTGNNRKVLVALEETGLDYRVNLVNIRKGEQFAPAFLAINPNNKVPAIVDHDGPGGEQGPIFESGAILEYIADRSGQLLPASGLARYRTLSWLHFTVTAMGPTIGQAHYFVTHFPEGNAHAAERFRNEAGRIFRILDDRLAEADWLDGLEYSIADISAYCRVGGAKNAGLDIADYPHIRAWAARIAERPAVKRVEAMVAELRKGKETPMTDEARSLLYGEGQFARH